MPNRRVETEGQFEEEATQKQLIIDGEPFVFIKKRDHIPIQVYKGDKGFLRTGLKDLIEAELEKHNHLVSLGYPLPKLLSTGEVYGQAFYIEESLGDNHLGDVFSEDFSKDGVVSGEHFKHFVDVSAVLADAQLRNPQESRNEQSFYLGMNMRSIIEELPDQRQKLVRVFERVKDRTGSLPYVWTHGDLNPYNLFPDGLIDIGNVHLAPAGYDLVSNIYHSSNFPKSGNFERLRAFDFTQEQRAQYFARMDRISTGLDPQLRVSDYIEDFIVCRAIWAAARMQHFPKLQQWRYDRLTLMAEAYLAGKPVVDIALSEK